jgi:hypothetical protein
MMISEKKENEKFTAEDLRYLKVAIALALGLDDIREMPKTKVAIHGLYEKIEKRRNGSVGTRFSCTADSLDSYQRKYILMDMLV